VRGLRVDVRGVDDPHLGYDRLDLVRGPASPDADVTLAVTHAPYQRVLDAYAADGADLIVAGHTHGGQVCVPGYGALVTNCDLDTSRVKGLSRWWPGAGSTPSSQAPADAAWLEVSAGLGTAPTAPVRLACRPEATLLTLVPRSQA
jgi:predicted MPP superfamily phosphohydrolase